MTKPQPRPEKEAVTAEDVLTAFRGLDAVEVTELLGRSPAMTAMASQSLRMGLKAVAEAYVATGHQEAGERLYKAMASLVELEHSLMPPRPSEASKGAEGPELEAKPELVGGTLDARGSRR